MAAETRAAPLSEAEPDVDEAAGGARRALTGKRCILLSPEVQLHFHVACYQQWKNRKGDGQTLDLQVSTSGELDIIGCSCGEGCRHPATPALDGVSLLQGGRGAFKERFVPTITTACLSSISAPLSLAMNQTSAKRI